MDGGNIIAKCSQCGAKNRIPASRIRDRPVCGRCRAVLQTDGAFPEKPIDITDADFHAEVMNFPGPVFVYMWAPWCGHCRRLSPLIDELSSEYAGRVKFVKMVLDQNPITASRYNIQGVPNMILFKNGTKMQQLVGALPKQELERHLNRLL